MTDSSPTIKELEQRALEANRALQLAREAEHEERTLGAFKERVEDFEQKHDDLIDRQTSYDTDSKARLFGFGAFTGQDGALLWVLAGSIFAVEKQMNEDFTLIKTAAEPLGVKESPDEVFNELTRIRFEGSAEQVREHKAELARREQKVRDNAQAAASGDVTDSTGDTTTQSGPSFLEASAAASRQFCQECVTEPDSLISSGTYALDGRAVYHSTHVCPEFVDDFDSDDDGDPF